MEHSDTAWNIIAQQLPWSDCVDVLTNVLFLFYMDFLKTASLMAAQIDLTLHFSRIR